ncbi:MAG: outer membrane lipoprotein LolB [Gammaproteobacteria bacterium]|nr:MAG: outer membrane lipoprotein LolB [Gammaproteobacteria bacterium]
MKHAPVILVCLMLMLQGCATQPDRAPTEPGRSAEAISNWILTGKLGVTRGKRRDFVAINRWNQEGNRYDIQLSSTLFGLGAARLSGSHDRVILEQGDERYVANNPEALIEDALGLALPLQALQWWVRGLPAPEQPAIRIRTSDDGQARLFTQHGWQVKLSRFQRHHGFELPGRIDLQRENLHIRLVITSWHLN